jgi:tetratricopeptide (TPR) repeat protein
MLPPSIRLLCLIGLLLACTQQSPAASDRIQFYYHIAEGNYLIGDTSGAENSIAQILRLDPAHAPALALKARILLGKGKADEALTTADAAIEAAPHRLEHQTLRALILGKLSRRVDAILQLDQVIDSAAPGTEDLAVARQLRGLMQMAEGNWDEAAAAFEAVYLADPQFSPGSRKLAGEAYLQKARAAMARADIDQALYAIDRAIRLYEDRSGSEDLATKDRLQLLRAQILARGQRTDEAIGELHQLLGHQPNHLEATVTLASLYASSKAWLALEDLIGPIARQPRLLDVALYLEGRVALSRNRVGTARAKFEEALELQSDLAGGLRAELLFYSGLCLERLGRKDQAAVRFEEAVETGFEPSNHRDALLLARTLQREGKQASAIHTLETALLRYPADETSAEAWSYLGKLHEEAGTNTLAVSAYNQSLSIKPNQATARAMRGALLRKIGDLEGAVSDFKIALELDPQNVALLYALALSELQLGRIVEAGRHLALALEISPHQPGQQLLHALIRFTIGTKTTAQASLEHYRSLVPNHENAAAHYLHALLQPDRPGSFSDPILQYFAGTVTRKEVLDWAGHAETPEHARSRICAAAFWLAQFETSHDRLGPARELLRLAVETGSPENPEWQFANWQLTNAFHRASP